MKKKFYPLIPSAAAMLLLVMSCAVTDPNIESARLYLLQGNYEEMIEAAEAAIESDPENGQGYYYMGVAYASIAGETEAPEDRLDNYRKAREYFDQAKALFEEQGVTSDEAENLPEVIVDLWGWEHNAAIDPLGENLMTAPEDSLRLSLHHLKNATTINPDSVQTFNIMAEVHYFLGEVDAAIEVSRHIIYEMQRADLYNYYRLGHFYVEKGEYENALEIAEQARELAPDDIEAIQEVANIYLRMGDTDKAIEVVSELIERDPENPQYRLVYATQIYQMVQDLDEEIRRKQDEIFDKRREVRQAAQEPDAEEEVILAMVDEISKIEDEVNELIEQSFQLSDESEDELLNALQMDDENPDIHTTLGIVYQNRAAIYQGMRTMADEMEEVERFDSLAREFLEKSLPHYEKAAELEPDDQENWMSLFRVYTNLGMEEEAEVARERAGFDL